MVRWACLVAIFFLSCQTVKKMHWPESHSPVTGNDFYHQAFAMKWEARDSFVLKEILAGDVPGFLKEFVPVSVTVLDSSSGKTLHATYYVAPDYLSIGTDDHWARINISSYAEL